MSREEGSDLEKVSPMEQGIVRSQELLCEHYDRDEIDKFYRASYGAEGGIKELNEILDGLQTKLESAKSDQEKDQLRKDALGSIMRKSGSSRV